MKKTTSFLLLGSVLTSLLFVGCASEPPRYEKMRTADDAVNKYDQNVIKDGMAITKKGSVVDIKVEEIQAQKNRLVAEGEEKDRKIERLEDKIVELEKDTARLRGFIGLPSEKPKAQGKCCTGDGKMIPGTIKPAPTLDEELSTVRSRKPKSEGEETQN